MNPLRQIIKTIKSSRYREYMPALYYWHYFYRPKAIYLPEDKLIYIPIQKVANTSVRRVIASYIGVSHYLSPENVHRSKPLRPYEFIGLADVAKLDDCFRFGFVRNPLDRLLSCYRNKVANHDTNTPFFFWKYGKKLHPEMTFAAFVEQVATIPDTLADKHFRSQHCFLHYEGRLVVDFVGRFEQLSQDWNTLCASYDFQPMPHKNPTKRADYREAYTPHTARLAAARYEKDIELFDYAGEVAALV